MIKQALLHEEFPNIAGFVVSGRSELDRVVGGDWYDLFASRRRCSS